MFIELLKDYYGQKAGSIIHVAEAIGKALIAENVGKQINNDPIADMINKRADEFATSLTKSMSETLDATLKEFAKAQSNCLKNRVPQIFGQGGEGDTKKSFGAFLHAVATKNFKALEEMGAKATDMSETTGSTGGFTVPTQFFPQLLMLSSEQSIVASRATVIPLLAPSIEVPALDHTTAPTAGETAFFGGVQANWEEENSTINQENPTFKQVLLRKKNLRGYTTLPNVMSADSPIGLDNILQQLFSGAIGWHIDYACLRGTGAGQPLGVTNWAGLIAVTRSGTSAFALADAAGMYAKLLPPNSGKGVCWPVSPTVLAKMMTMAATAVGGNSVYIDNARDKPQMMLFGYPVIPTEKLPALNTQGDVLLCDFERYIVGVDPEIAIAFSEHVNFLKDQGTWRFRTRVDGRPWLNNYVTLSDATSTLSPFVALAAG